MFNMVIQVTKTKSITIGGAKGKHRRSTDVVGIDMYGGDERGFPAVRLAYKKGSVKVVASGFIPSPGADLPDSWESAVRNPTWLIPSQFQAPHAAFSVSSSELFLTQTTLETAKKDILSGAHQAEDPGTAVKARRFGIKREAKKPEPKKEDDKPAESGIDISTLEPGVPISNGGTRFVMCPLSGADDFVIEAGMPEYQVLWLSRLLPEGRRPTVASVQPRLAAFTASILRDPEFLKAGGTGMAIFIDEDNVILAGFRNGDLVMWRKCRGIEGARSIRAQLAKGLGISEDMLDGILNDNIIDPRPVLESILMPFFDELIVSRDYLAGKLGIALNTAFISGLDSGINYWNGIAEDHAQLKFIECKSFAGIEGHLPEAKDAKVFTCALGAALALMAEDDE